MKNFETGENYNTEESIVTLKNAALILQNGGNIEGKSITGTQIKNAIINILKLI